MGRSNKRPATVLRPRPARRDRLFQVHPMPRTGDDILLVASRLLEQFAVAQGKEVPGFSQDAATFLTRRYWALADLARRVWDAVVSNRGNLVTADDLSRSRTPHRPRDS